MKRDEAENRRVAAAVKRELRATFGPRGLDAPWYENVGRVTSNAGDVNVETNLYPDADADSPANAVCSIIRPNGSGIPGVTGGRVQGSDGGVLKRC